MAGAEVVISSRAASGQDGEAEGDISDPLIVMGWVLVIVPTTADESWGAAIPADARAITRIVTRDAIFRDTIFRGTMLSRYQ
jgi:hypothetical protein